MGTMQIWHVWANIYFTQLLELIVYSIGIYRSSLKLLRVVWLATEVKKSPIQAEGLLCLERDLSLLASPGHSWGVKKTCISMDLIQVKRKSDLEGPGRAPWLRAFTALEDDLCLVPSTTQGLTTTCNSSCRESHCLFWSLKVTAGM